MTARHPSVQDARPAPGLEAARWAIAFESGELTRDDERAFALWIAADEAHLLAYEDALWALHAVRDHAATAEIIDMRNVALRTRPAGRRGFIVAGTAALAASLALALVWSPLGRDAVRDRSANAPEVAENPDRTEYATRVGERSAITLPDGSVVTLDTKSRLRVAYDSRERAVYLLEGQAMFEVAHGRPLPFNVYARGQRITAVGTVFNVRIEGQRVRVAMVEGVVKVRRDARAGETGTSAGVAAVLTLTAGEALVAEPARAMVVEPVDARQISSWTGGMLIFNDSSLADAVAEINRYTVRPLVLSDPEIGRYRLSGVFKSNDPEHFAVAMAEVLPVEVVKGGDGAFVLRARN